MFYSLQLIIPAKVGEASSIFLEILFYAVTDQVILCVFLYFLPLVSWERCPVCEPTLCMGFLFKSRFIAEKDCNAPFSHDVFRNLIKLNLFLCRQYYH